LSFKSVRNHTDTLQHIHVHLCMRTPSKLKVGGNKWGSKQRAASQSATTNR